MKKIFFIICISFYLICNSNAAGYKARDKVSGIFEPVRYFKIDLPPGEWIVTQSANDSFYGLRWRSYILVRLENGKFSLTRFFLKKNLTVGIVGKNGKFYLPNEWKESKTYKYSRQENLLISDNQTNLFLLNIVNEKKRLIQEFIAWGL